MHQEIRRADATAFTFNARGPSAGFEAAVTRPRLLVVPAAAPPSSAPLRGHAQRFKSQERSWNEEAHKRSKSGTVHRGPDTHLYTPTP